MTYGLVWFKRDLRLQDHAALSQACLQGKVRCIYVVEPGLWLEPDAALQHFEFIRESLTDLDQSLRLLGGGIEIHTGELTEVLSKIWRESPFERLYSHQETGNGYTYGRDLKVASWCQEHRIAWNEYPHFGVVRGLKDRKIWQSAWEQHMASPAFHEPDIHFFKPFISPIKVVAPAHLKNNPPKRQRGGLTAANNILRSFLNARSLGYRGGISSPLSAPDACSRLSPYLAYGCISMREVVQETRQFMTNLPPQAERHRAGLNAFVSRLYWHCHFIQKLESEPAIEWQNMHRGYDGLREEDFNVDHFEILKAGRTGWPMVDACVAMLRETGWLNFRMRAMLVSVSAYPLWLHWRPVGEWLATQFLDYEPGIHWSQMQMQSGTTGINITRIYNPIKQAKDHDPRGVFVRRWLPDMRRVPDTWLLQPWDMPQSVQASTGLRVGQEIAGPVVELSTATREAKSKMYARRHDPNVRAGKKEVVERHASRKIKSHGTRKKVPPSGAEKQLGFDF